MHGCRKALPVGSDVRLLILTVPMASYGTQLPALVEGRTDAKSWSRALLDSVRVLLWCEH